MSATAKQLLIYNCIVKILCCAGCYLTESSRGRPSLSYKFRRPALSESRIAPAYFATSSARANVPAWFPEVKRDLFGGSRQKSRRSNFAECSRDGSFVRGSC